MISHTTLRFAISSWKYIPRIAALHLTMPPVLGEHPFTEWIHHRSDKAVVSYSLVSPYFTKALTITEVSCLVVALSAKGKELWQDSGNTANELFKRDKKNIQECNEFCVLWHDALNPGYYGHNRATSSPTMQSQGCKDKSIFITSPAPVGFVN